MRTREGIQHAKATKGKLKGGKPKLNARQSARLAEVHAAGEHSISERFSVGRATVHCTIARSAG
jgi:DNA invertase Pin-like site-specific DNA recombinase